MEKSGEEKQSQFSKAKCSSNTNIWDCGSALYDSYELNSFKRQLDSAIANSPRSLSMPHIRERERDLSLQVQSQPQPPSFNNKSFKISRPFQKLLRFVFKSSSTNKKVAEKDRFYVVYDKSEPHPVLSTIPELPEFEMGGLSPEFSSLVRKSASERFTATAIGISCA